MFIEYFKVEGEVGGNEKKEEDDERKGWRGEKGRGFKLT